jgi:hypothetical protein
LPVFSIGAQINPHNKILLEKVKEFFGGIGWISACVVIWIHTESFNVYIILQVII